jgi:hypothetical protein
VIYDAVVPADEREKVADVEHTGIATIWTSVSRIAKDNAGATKAERRAHAEVVDFWASTRNTIHSNTVYCGKSAKKLSLSNGFVAKLVPGKPTDFMHRSHMPLLIQPLIDAWEYLRAGITRSSTISMPDCIDETLCDRVSV